MAYSKPLNVCLDLQCQGKLSKLDAMENEVLRLSSFMKFPQNVPVSAIQLSKAGFFYCGYNDEVECFSCHIKIRDWDNRNPFRVHKEHSPNCPFIVNNVDDTVGNSYYVPSEKPNVLKNSVREIIDQKNSKTFSKSETSDAVPGPQSQIYSRDGNFASSAAKAHNVSSQYANGNLPRQTETVNSASSPVNDAVRENNTQGRQNQSEQINDYRYEKYRLQSFTNWPSNASVGPEDLAKSGFYYTGTDDRVQCTFCRGILRNWEPGDQPESEHRRHFGQCPFLNSPESVGNVPIGREHAQPTRVNKEDLSRQDYCKGIITDSPVHQQYSLPADRLATFKGFPVNIIQTPEQFTRAGFFYSGISDSVKCFFCDGGLRNWEPNDDLWTEHARWFPRCGFLRLCKGDEFIKSIQDRYAPSSLNKKPPRLRNNINKKKHKVNEDTVNEYMRGPIVKASLDMGCDPGKIKLVIVRRIEDLGDEFFPNCESLLDAVLEYEEELKYKEVHGEDSNNSLEDNNEESEKNAEATAETSENPNKKKNKKKKKKPKKKAAKIEDPAPLQYMNEEDAQHLTKDIEKMKDERRCKICMDEEVNIVFLKCGHLVCCSNCAPALRHCPICRQPIRGTVRVFIS